MEKIRKHIFGVLIVVGAFLFTIKTVDAALLPYRDLVVWNYEVKHKTFSWTGSYREKEGWAYNYVKVDSAETTLTHPCKTCLISFKLKSSDGAYYTGTLGLTTEDEKYKMPCTDGCSAPNNYDMGLMRVDFTLLTTVTGWTWRYQ